MSYPALLTDVNGVQIPQWYDGSAWQPFQDTMKRTVATPTKTLSIPYSSMTGTSYTATVPVSRNAIMRAVGLFNTTNTSFSNVNFSFYDSTFPSIGSYVQSGASSSWQPNGSLAVNSYSIFNSDDTTASTVLRTPMNQLLIHVSYTTAPTSGTFDIWLIEQT